jgi:uncharacterized protein (TIGR00266 family)
MRSKIIGSILPVLEIELSAGDKVIGVPDQLSWMSGDVTLTTGTAGGGTSGMWGLVSRAVSGAGLFMTEFRAEHGPGNVAFAAKLPGHMIELEIGGAGGRGYVAHRHGFVCGTEGIEISAGFQKSLGAGIFGGDGLVLQKIGGNGTAWFELGGELIPYDLQPGQTLLVHPGHVGIFEDQVTFEITTMKGIKNVLFGGDGLFLAKLTGPGRVWLQTLTEPGMAHALSPYLPKAH